MQKIQNNIISTLFALSAILLLSPPATAAELQVAAANSTCAALKEAGEIFTRQQGVTIHYTCKSSGLLAKGLETDYITADYYISASRKWMDELVAKGFIAAETVTPLWENRIIAAAADHSAIELQSWEDLASPKVTTIVVGDPSTTPLGRQFKVAMEAQGLWEQIRSKITIKRHLSLTREALLTADQTTIGILLPTTLGHGLKPLLDLPREWHEPIRYYAGPLANNRNKEETAQFAAFLSSETAKAVFRKKGYLILP